MREEPLIQTVEDVSIEGYPQLGDDVTDSLLAPDSGAVLRSPRKAVSFLPVRGAGGRAGGETVSRLIVQVAAVDSASPIEDLADDFIEDKDCDAVGVVDRDGAPVGIVTKDALLEMFGRPYGRDVLRRHPVAEIASHARVFRLDDSILSVVEATSAEAAENWNARFIAIDGSGRFAGVFSAREIFAYLYERTTRDLVMARTIQERIVPERATERDGVLALAEGSRMAVEVGGDFCRFRGCGQGRWIAALCDVSGKGVAASLVTSILGGVFGFYDFSEGLVPFVEKLNELFHRTFASERFATGIFMELDAATGSVTWCDMGHSYAFVLRGGKFLSLRSDDGNPPIGVLDSVRPALRRFKLRPGDVLAAVTDGILEQRDAEGREYGAARLGKAVAAAAPEGAPAVVDAILGDLAAASAGVPRHDDATVLAITYGDPAAG